MVQFFLLRNGAEDVPSFWEAEMQQKERVVVPIATGKKGHQQRHVERVVTNWLRKGKTLDDLKKELRRCCCHKEHRVTS